MDKMTYLLFRQEAHDAEAHHMSVLETQFPRIVEHLVELWQSGACDEYLKKLLLDDRGDRHGFPPEIVDDLILLDAIHWSHSHEDGTAQFGNNVFDFRFSSTPVARNTKPAGSQGWIKRTFGL